MAETDAHTAVSDPTLPARVLIVGANYWPEESGNAPYTTGFAEDLAARGVEVTVLCAMPHYPGWQIREEYRGRRKLREVREGVRLVRSWLWVPKRQSALHRALFEGSFFLGALLVSMGIRRPDVVIGVTPSLSGALAASILAKRFRVPYGLIVQDLVGPGATQSGISGGAQVASSVQRAEGWAFSGASGVAIVSAGFAPYLRQQGVDQSRVQVIANWSHITPSEVTPQRARAQFGLAAEGEIVVLHAGAMGLKQGLEQVVGAARLDEKRGGSYRFVLAGDGSQRELLAQRSSGLDNVSFLPQQPAEEYASLLAASDVLLISERPGMANMSLPGKLTSYVVAGRPIVAAVASDGATAAEVVASGAGIVTPAGNSQELLAALDRVTGDLSLAAELAEAGPAYAQQVLGRERCLARCRSYVSGLVAQEGVRGDG